MVASATELYNRVTAAESTCAHGDIPRGYRLFKELLSDIVLRSAELSSFGHNECLVLQRVADLAVPVGEIQDALDLYAAFAATKAKYHARALAAYKRLQIAVESGRMFEARAAYTCIVQSLWAHDPPESAFGFPAWERCFPIEQERESFLAQMYLSIGKLYNASRRLEASTMWLEQGLRHTDSCTGAARVSSIPILLALANNKLCEGELEQSRELLKSVAARIAADETARIYRIWHGLSAAKVALVQGRLREALTILTQTEEDAKGGGLLRARCKCLLAQAEVAMLLNLLPEGDKLLAAAIDIMLRADFADARPEIERLVQLRASRSQFTRVEEIAESVAHMQTGTPETANTACEEATQADEHVIWSGDCLRDYELREALVYSALESRPDEARHELLSLRQDFRNVGSRLLAARIAMASGLLFARYGQKEESTRELSDAADQFRAMGAERERMQANVHLAAAIEKTAPARHAQLLKENERLLNSLTATLTTEQRNAFLLNKYTQAEEALRAAVESILDAQNSARSSPWWARISRTLRYGLRLHDFLCALDAERERRRRHGNQPRNHYRTGLRGLLRRLVFHPRKNQTVGFIVLPRLTFIFGLRRGRITCHVSRVTRPSVADALDTMHKILGGIDDAGTDFGSAASWLYEQTGLAEVLRSVPKRINSLTILPDGPLHVVPFAALPFTGSSGGTYLIDRFAINIDDVTHRKRSETTTQMRAVFGCYGGTKYPLQLARSTMDNAMAWLQRESGIDCTEATSRDQLQAALPQASFFYYFGHGSCGGVDAERTGFELGRDPQFISLRDLDNIDFSDVKQAVLFACYGGDAVAAPGRWVISLPEAMLRRGAEAVLSAVWAVKEQVATKLSPEFLEHSRKVGRARALQDFIIKCKADHPDPYWWAGLQVHGDPGPLKLHGAIRNGR